jgi:hypothetical protein
MTDRRLIRILVVIQWVVLIATLGAAVLEQDNIQGPLKDYLDQQGQAAVSAYGTAIVYSLYFMGYAAACIGLMAGRRWGAKLYLLIVGAGIALTVFGEASVVTPWAGAMAALFTILSGLIPAAVYLPGIRDSSVMKKPQAVPEAVVTAAAVADNPESLNQDDAGGQPASVADEKTTGVRILLRDLMQNIRAGLRGLFLLKIGTPDFRVSADQLLLLVAIDFVYDVLSDLAAAGVNVEFQYQYIPNAFFYLVVIFFFSYFLSRVESKHDMLLTVPLVIMTIILPVSVLISVIEILRLDDWFHALNYIGGGPYHPLFIWGLLASYIAVARLYRPIARKLLFFSLFFGLLAVPFWLFPRPGLWIEKYDDKVRPVSAAKEKNLYSQSDFLDRQLASLKPGRRGVIDLYFVGFGGDSSQDVFMKEIAFITRLFNERFDAAGRSVQLINNSKTLEETPIASLTALERTLTRIGSLMNREEDILFLYLTSHGSRDHKLKIRFWPLELNDITAAELKRIIAASGIRWKVIVVSACYSGGFIEPLKDDYTLIITASDSDKASYGCSNYHDFTYFGKAYFEETLQSNYSFYRIFDEVKEKISKREQSESETSSNPQMHVGEKIKDRLDMLEARLRKNAN